MAILLLGECSPRRQHRRAFDNHQGTVIAQHCGVTLPSLLSQIETMYLVPKYVPSHKRCDASYLVELRLWWNILENDFVHDFDLLLVVGKRLMGMITSDFKPEFFTYMQHRNMDVACIPKPLAKTWWTKQRNIEAYNKFMLYALNRYTSVR